jgi:outer membrane protein TolC
LATRKLNVLLGRELDAPLRLSGSLDAPAESPIRSNATDAVVQNNPAVRRAHLQQELSETMIEHSRALRRPKLELLGSYAWVDNDLIFKGSYGAVALNLSIPFVREIVAGSAAVEQARARNRLARSFTLNAEREVQIAVEQAVRLLDEARAAVEVAKTNLEYHREKYRVKESAFKEELITYSELLDDHVALAEADLEYFTAQHDLRVAEANMTRITAGSQ